MLLAACAVRGREAPAPVSAPRDGGDPDRVDPRTVQPERPSVATHAGTVAPGWLELESGVERDRFADGARALVVPTLVKLGLAPRLQLSVQLPVIGGSAVPTGFGDAALGVKWRIVERHRALQNVALLPQLKFASGGVRGTGTTDASLLLIDSRTVGPLGLDLNLGATARSGDGSRAPRTATLWTASFGIPVRGAISWGFESYGYPGTRGAAGSAPIVAILTGPSMMLGRSLALDVGAIVPVEGPQPHALYAGVVTSLGRLIALSTPSR